MGAPIRALLFTVCVISHASANDLALSNGRGNVARRLHCDSSRPEFMITADSGACVRISGYIAAGGTSAPDDRIGGRPSPFGPLAAPRLVTSSGAPALTAIDAPADLGREFMQAIHGDVIR
jgi:hypothetical protein